MLVLLPGLLLAAGCGASEPGLVPVSGKITLDGGPWPREGVINFTSDGPAPGGASTTVRPGSAKFDVDGSFVAGSFEEGDGLFPGAYKLSVTCSEAPPQITSTGKFVEGKSVVPKKYQDPNTSGLTLTVKEGESTYETFDVKTHP
jgi:hypothetical protein